MSAPMIGAPGYVYRPWSDDRRAQASENAKKRISGIIVPRVDIQAEVKANKALIAAQMANTIWTPELSEPIWHQFKEKRAKLRAERMKAARAARAVRVAPRLNLSYPYIIKRRDEHGDLIAINDIVPKSIPGDIRADICQEIMLAVLEGTITIDALRAKRDNTGYFVKKFYQDNYEQAGHSISFDAEEADRQYDEIALSIAAKDWHHSEIEERSRYTNLVRTFTSPTQLHDVYQSQISREQERLHALGRHLSFEEVEDNERAAPA